MGSKAIQFNVHIVQQQLSKKKFLSRSLSLSVNEPLYLQDIGLPYSLYVVL